jgi:hypothetical protein
MIMSPFCKIEMSPLVGLNALEVHYEGEGTNEHKRGRKA